MHSATKRIREVRLSGNRDCSGKYKVVREGQKKERRDWISSSMQNCKPGFKQIFEIVTNEYRDGKHPKEQIAQILSIAPVLPKQMLQGRTSQLPTRPAQQAQPGPSKSVQAPGGSIGATTSQPTRQELKDITGPKLERQDSITSDLDEFVDAKN